MRCTAVPAIYSRVSITGAVMISKRGCDDYVVRGVQCIPVLLWVLQKSIESFSRVKLCQPRQEQLNFQEFAVHQDVRQSV
jgi:hypothetical protein